MKPKICRIRTGGTIDMVKDPVTGVYRIATPEELIDNIPGLDKIVRFDLVDDVIKPIDSSDMVPKYWGKIAEAVIEQIDDYDGFTITHGTDTMHYTSAALSFMLKNLKKPVVLTGSMVPLSEPESDAPKNLRDVFRTAGYSKLNEVCIVFNSKIIKGTRAKKVRLGSFDAFESINCEYLGNVSGDNLKLNVKVKEKKTDGEPFADTKIDPKVGEVKVFPGMNPEIIDFYVDKGYKGIIIEGFGCGGANTQENSIIPSIERATENGVPVFMCTQCNRGRVKLAYDVGLKLKNAGVISLHDMLPEVAVVKLMYVAGHVQEPEEIKKMMLKNIAGEVKIH